MKNSEPIPFMTACQMCGRTFQFGPHIYNGKMVPAYRLMTCLDCYDGNHDGWAPAFEPRLEQHLREKGIPIPSRNRRGLYPRG